MMHKVLFLLPNQLFYDKNGKKRQSPTIAEHSLEYDEFYIIEHPKFFRNVNPTAVVLQLIFMKKFYNELEKPKHYVKVNDYNLHDLCKKVHKEHDNVTIYTNNPEDFDIFKELDDIKYDIHVANSRLFLLPFSEAIQCDHENYDTFCTIYKTKYQLKDEKDNELNYNFNNKLIKESVEYVKKLDKSYDLYLTTNIFSIAKISKEFLNDIGFISPWAPNMITYKLIREYLRMMYLKHFVIKDRSDPYSQAGSLDPYSQAGSLDVIESPYYEAVLSKMIDHFTYSSCTEYDNLVILHIILSFTGHNKDQIYMILLRHAVFSWKVYHISHSNCMMYNVKQARKIMAKIYDKDTSWVKTWNDLSHYYASKHDLGYITESWNKKSKKAQHAIEKAVKPFLV